ncbi:MAG: ribbon-helix-helix protein, CopG family [Acidimicrobiaceae bacterium]|nr:ribbon-helix-helix protein, CopG family [Acidimicrobiaceae bacterium]
MPTQTDTKNLTLRIDRTLADQAQTVAAVEGSTVSDVIRDALTEHVERRRRDPEFQARLRRNLERHQELLNMLADS